ncbi:hypothetical protein LIER_43657 [Lithospermum erythrorhizon]|uniref:Uncharacterized protein n=1 Tax=Lithospermum erythrorhizon TaxID=34254 RepID=A0AAV3QKB9_LITER
MSWPQDMPKFEDVCDLLNNGHSFPPGDVRNETKCVTTNFLDGDDKFSLKVLNDYLFCSGSNDSHVPYSQTVLLYRLRMGLPINVLGLISNILFNSIEYHKNHTYSLGMLISYIVHLISKWQRGLPIDAEEGQAVRGEEVRTEAPVHASSSRDGARDDFALWIELYRLASVQEE